MRRLFVLFALLLAGGLQAAPFRATVTHVSDGDTVWVRPAGGGAPQSVRLVELDAPELCQRFGPEARQALEQRLRKQTVRVRPVGRDDYQRMLGRLEHRGEDVGAWLVGNGYAWSSGFRGRPGRYASLQEQARAARRGLWRDARPEPPRDFRRRHGRCR